MNAYTKALVVICTRPDSARLPRKAFKRIAGVPAIEHILKRLGTDMEGGTVPEFPVVLAVPTDCHDYDHLTTRYFVSIYRGESASPLHRMRAALMDWALHPERTIPKYVIRVTHDDLLIDLKTVGDLVRAAEEAGAGYAITPEIVNGAGVEVIHVSNLIAAADAATSSVEHISYHVRGEKLPNPKVLTMRPRESICRPYRLTLDYEADAVVLEAVLRRTAIKGARMPLTGFASVDDICAYMDENPHLRIYNSVPVVSVYICAYNAEATIGAAVLSVPDQCSLGPVELVVVDDQSTDGTLRRLIQLAPEIDTLIVNEENQGSASTANAALRRCRGRYVVRLDADDSLERNALDDMLRAMEGSGAGVIYPTFTEVDAKTGAYLRGPVDPREKPHAGCALMDRRAFDVRYESGRRHWDGLELFNRIRREGVKVGYFDARPLWIYRRSPGTLSATMTPERAAALKTAGGF